MTLEIMQLKLLKMLVDNNETKETFLEKANQENNILVITINEKEQLNDFNLKKFQLNNYSIKNFIEINETKIERKSRELSMNLNKFNDILNTILSLVEENLADKVVKDKFIVFCNSEKFKNFCIFFDFMLHYHDNNPSQINNNPQTPLLDQIYPYVKEIQSLQLSPSLQYFAAQKVKLKP